MTTVGVRELRQNASEIVRRVEGGESVDITVAGRLAARLVPVTPQPWRRWDDLADLFSPSGPARSDPNWERDRDLVDDDLTNPWDQ